MEKQTIKATANHSARTFTLIKQDGTKYRTTRMSKEEFNSNLYNTSKDWFAYLYYTEEYYVVSK